MDRDELLRSINMRLEAHQISPFTKLGMVEKGEDEIVELLSIVPNEHGNLAVVTLRIMCADGVERVQTMTSNIGSLKQDGPVFVLLMSGHFVLVKGWRFRISRWTTECPRMFQRTVELCIGDKLTSIVGSKFADLLRLEFGSQTQFTIKRTVPLTHLAENTGMSHDFAQVYLVEIEANEDAIERLKDSADANRKVQAWSPKKVREEMGKSLIDLHTISALALAMNYLADNPSL